MKHPFKPLAVILLCTAILIPGSSPALCTKSYAAETPEASAMPTPCDVDALPCAEELLQYLHTISDRDKVIFGHQNDTDFTVRSGILSDVEDLTGDISGIVGFDTLDLTGQNAKSRSKTGGLNEIIRLSTDAAQRGALITLSAHMPNFGSSSNIRQFADGSYSFLNCQLKESKDLTGNCALEVLPNGKYNTYFNAYLDLIARYGLALQEKEIPVLFRPFHEGNGGWFWWGNEAADANTYIALFRYTKDYLTSKGVHNFLYVYSPNGPIGSKSEYMERYPGDSYVDIVAIDYYNGGYTMPAEYSEEFFVSLNNTCKIVGGIAASHGKIPAISETGIWIRIAGDPKQDGLIESGNPVNDKAWYQRVGEIAIANDMPYYLVWSNGTIKSFHVPFKYDDTHYHEMADDFINFYNEDYSIFAGEVNFYNRLYKA